MQSQDTDNREAHEQRLAWDAIDDRAAVRMVALMGGHEWLRWRADFLDALSPPHRRRRFAQSGASSDRLYFMQRSLEEKEAAKDAVGRKARDAHEQLAARYEELANYPSSRQDALLDHALKETFPASDPVSVAHVS